MCEFKKDDNQIKIIHIEDEILFVNKVKKISLFWGCPGFEKLYELESDVWTTLDPGCHIRIDEHIFDAPIALNIDTIQNTLIHVDIH